jgi:hypothetical protein
MSKYEKRKLRHLNAYIRVDNTTFQKVCDTSKPVGHHWPAQELRLCGNGFDISWGQFWLCFNLRL